MLFLTFFSGSLSSPAVTVELSNPTNAHKVDVAANETVESPFPSGARGIILILSKFKNATIINKAKNPILNTVTKLCIFPACLTPTIFNIVTAHNIELVKIIDINGC